jgi:hypothetical protein
MQKILNSPNVHEHMDTQRDSHVSRTPYSLCPTKQFSIAFLRGLGEENFVSH